MNKLVALIILPVVATIYATAPSLYIFVATMNKISAVFGG